MLPQGNIIHVQKSSQVITRRTEIFAYVPFNADVALSLVGLRSNARDL